jgi:hypothetical protein
MVKCKVCGKQPNEISEYKTQAKVYKITPEEYVRQEEGTYNLKTGLFYCTSCYIKIGMPRGRA